MPSRSLEPLIRFKQVCILWIIEAIPFLTKCFITSKRVSFCNLFYSILFIIFLLNAKLSVWILHWYIYGLWGMLILSWHYFWHCLACSFLMTLHGLARLALLEWLGLSRSFGIAWLVPVLFAMHGSHFCHDMACFKLLTLHCSLFCQCMVCFVLLVFGIAWFALLACLGAPLAWISVLIQWLRD